MSDIAQCVCSLSLSLSCCFYYPFVGLEGLSKSSVLGHPMGFHPHTPSSSTVSLRCAHRDWWGGGKKTGPENFCVFVFLSVGCKKTHETKLNEQLTKLNHTKRTNGPNYADLFLILALMYFFAQTSTTSVLNCILFSLSVEAHSRRFLAII